MAIKFGTDGWRAVIADEYTFENLKKLSKATAITFANHDKVRNGIVIGYDTRFLSKEFAECSANVFANHGINVYLTDSFVTTPTVSMVTRDKNLPYGVMITSSHNPAKYSGYKLKDEHGGSMGPDLLGKVEQNLASSGNFDYGSKSFEECLDTGCIEYFPGKKYYVENLRNKIDSGLISSGDLKILYDAMYGSGQGMMDELIETKSIHSEVDPNFGGTNPEPVQKNLSEISQLLKNGAFDIGIATDGDADRIAILDENGNFVDAQKTFALLLLYLLECKKLSGGVVRGFSSSELIKKICDSKGLKLYTVPIGFKYISDLMIKEDILIGAEESGGIGIKNHLPERDGIYNGLLFCEMLALKRKKLSELLNEIERSYGRFFYKRIDKHLDGRTPKETLVERARNLSEIAGEKVTAVDTLDGCKLSTKNGWLLVRPSGTEPLLRLYAETYEIDRTEPFLEYILRKLNL
jgi:phosphomannomutase